MCVDQVYGASDVKGNPSGNLVQSFFPRLNSCKFHKMRVRKRKSGNMSTSINRQYLPPSCNFKQSTTYLRVSHWCCTRIYYSRETQPFLASQFLGTGRTGTCGVSLAPATISLLPSSDHLSAWNWLRESFITYKNILCSLYHFYIKFFFHPQETGYNQGHFPHNVLQGCWEAIWWAFASMTTLG